MTCFRVQFLVILLLAALNAVAAEDSAKPPVEEKIAGPEGLTFVVRMQGPYDADVPLQIVCYFKKHEGQVLQGAPVELDRRLNGLIENLRTRGEFVGDELETLVINTKGMIPAKKLLLIGLGDESKLTLDLMERVGRVAFREATKLGATSVAFAPLLRDQGNDKLATGDVETRVVHGVLLARDTELRLRKEGLATGVELTTWIVEAGPAYFKETITGVTKGIAKADSLVKTKANKPLLKSSNETVNPK